MYALLTLVLPGGEDDLQAVLIMEDTVASGKSTPKSMSLAVLSPVEEEEEDLRPGDLTKQREEHRKRELYEEAKYLLDFYSKKTLMALIKCTRYVDMKPIRMYRMYKCFSLTDISHVAIILTVNHLGSRWRLSSVE